MLLSRVRGCVLLAAICLLTFIGANAGENNVPVIDLSNNISAIERLKINSDPTLMTSVTTEWELALDSPADANENGHALLYHDGNIYTYTNVYGVKANPVIRQYDAFSSEVAVVEREVNLQSISGIWNGNSIMNHAVAVYDNGVFLLVFGAQNNSDLYLVAYDFESDAATYIGKATLSTGALNISGLNNSSISFSDGIISGDVFGDCSLTINVLASVGGSVDCSIPIYITINDGVCAASRVKPGTDVSQFYMYGETFCESRAAHLCEIDDTYMVVSHCLPQSFTPKSELGRISLFERKDGYYDVKEVLADEMLMPNISTDGNGEGDCLGMYVVRHDGHNVMVYASSYIGSVRYNLVLWDDPSSFANMRLIGQIMVPGNISQGSAYERGIRQMVVAEPQTEPTVGVETYPTKDYFKTTTFYTYAPGAALAKHRITTEEDKIYTALSEPTTTQMLRVEGGIIVSGGDAPVVVCNAGGSVVAEYAPAREINAEALGCGLYIIRCGMETVKAVF